MNRFFTRQELAEAYRHPQHVLEQFLAEVGPVELDDRGESLSLEAHEYALLDLWNSRLELRASTLRG